MVSWGREFSSILGKKNIMENQAELVKKFTDVMADFTAYFGKHLPDDVQAKLEELRAEQTTDMAKIIYDAMFKDIALAKVLDRPMCQDTGVIQYFIEVGDRFPILGKMQEALAEATRRATVQAPLRHNAVQIFDEKNSGNNTGHRIPWIDWDIVPDSDECVIYAYMAGGGCSLPGTAKVLMPVEGYEGIVQYIFDTMVERGINACPPVLVGVGIAGSVEVAARLSKKALMRPVGSHNPNPRGAEMERLLEEGLNKLNVGPGGLTGVKSVMGVNIEDAARHPSCLAVGISMGCWAHRRAAIKLHADMSYELLSYKGVRL
jgi:hydrolyase, tartrate alpha subunit/fumarate domain protein, Fe-S type